MIKDANKISEFTSSVWCFYYLVTLAIWFIILTHPPQGLWAWLNLVFLMYYQTAMLSGLGTTSNICAKKTDTLLQSINSCVIDELKELKQIVGQV